jgi:hypothetical protein
VIARPDQRPGGHESESELAADALVLRKCLGRDVSGDGRVLRCGPQILPDGNDVDSRGAKIAERLDHLVVRLPDAHHDRALGEALRSALLGVGNHLEGAVVAASRVTNERRHPP